MTANVTIDYRQIEARLSYYTHSDFEETVYEEILLWMAENADDNMSIMDATIEFWRERLE